MLTKNTHLLLIWFLIASFSLPLTLSSKAFRKDKHFADHSTERYVQDTCNGLVPAHTRLPAPGSSVKGFLAEGLTANAWMVMPLGNPVPAGPIAMDIPSGTHSNIQVIYHTEVWMSGADYVEDTWYASGWSTNNSGLYTIDPYTGDYTLVGSMGRTSDGIAWNHETQTLYGVGIDNGVSVLFSIDRLTAATTVIGSTITGVHMIAIADGEDGLLYGIGLDDNLYTIDTATGLATLVGPLGYPINYAQGLGYDRDNETLYGTLYTTSDEGGLFEIDTQTGQATMLNNYISQVTSLAIPYAYADDDAPGMVENFTVTPGSLGANEAQVSWDNPTVTASGEPLTELTEVRLLRNNEIITQYTDVTPGQSITYTDNDIDEPGLFTYRIFAVNSQGEGLKTNETAFVGEDGPGAPLNVTLTQENGNANIDWNAPETGFNGGWFDTDGLLYNVFRMPGQVLVAEAISATETVDASVDEMGNYYYIVAAYNNFATGGTGASNTLLMNAPERMLMYETFDNAIGNFPAGWYRDGVPHAWSVWDSDNAGGTAPELLLYFNPSYLGESRMVRSSFPVYGYSAVVLDFNQLLVNRDEFNDEEAAIEISWDEGNHWEPLWEMPVESSIAPGSFQLFSELPENTENLMLAMRFTGDTWNIIRWNLDDFIMMGALENDLQARKISGNITPTPGYEVNYTVNVSNVGMNTQDNYTVKLMHEDGRELAATPGVSLDFGENHDFILSWTPDPDEPTGTANIYGLVVLENDQNPEDNQTDYYAINMQMGDILAITIGTDQTIPPVRMPFDFYWKNSLAQTLYYNHEIGHDELIIAGLTWFNSFVSAQNNKQIQIWVGETQEEEIPFTWIDPASLTLVFDGYVNFPEGENEVQVMFDIPYSYAGDNLVVYTHRVFENQFAEAENNFFGTFQLDSKRSIRAADDSPLNPENPNISMRIDWFPNIRILYLDAQTGIIDGHITDDEGGIVGFVDVTIPGTAFSTVAEEDGYFIFPGLLEGTYNLQFSKDGYQTVIIEDVEVVGDETTTLDVVLPLTGEYVISGSLEGNNGMPVEGAAIRLEGFSDFHTTSAADGSFVLEDVPQDTYTLKIAADFYHFYYQEELTLVEDTDLGIIELEERIVDPAGLKVSTENLPHGNAMLSWAHPATREFLFDENMVQGELGVEGGTWNSVMGTAHRSVSVLNDMSWYLTSVGGPHNFVEVWVFGLDENGMPDPDQLLYHQTQVPNVDEQWNTYTFSQPVESLDGFFIGVSYFGFLAIAHDTGESDDWPFQPNTHFFIGDVNETEFVPIEEFGFKKNLLIRASGVDYGHIFPAAAKSNQITEQKYLLTGSEKAYPVAADIAPPSWNTDYIKTSLVPDSYNIYLDNELVDNVDNETPNYLFEALEPGTYTAGVRALYVTGNSQPTHLGFEITEIPLYAVTFTVTDDSEYYQALRIKGDMTEPPWKDIDLDEGPEHTWTTTLELPPGTWQWGITEDDGSTDGQWLLPEGEYLAFTIDHEGNIEGDISYTLLETAINNYDVQAMLVFPNPAKHHVNLKSNTEIISVAIVDLGGREVLFEKVNQKQHQIHVSNLTGGLYFLRANTVKGVIHEKMEIKQ